MHPEQQQFCERLRSRFPHLFQDKKVLDCGSADVNGNNRYLFSGGAYTGVDLAPGSNVDRVCLIHELDDGPGSFDTVISTECLEHDQYAEKSIKKMIDLVSPSGILIITCATTGRTEHGTVEHDPDASPGTNQHYRNIRPEEISGPLAERFKCWSVEVHHCDLYAWAIDKKEYLPQR